MTDPLCSVGKCDKRNHCLSCKIEGCDSKPYCRSMCQKHYERVLRNGDPHKLKINFTRRGAVKKWLDDIHSERPWEKSDSCIIWPFFKTNGYPTLNSKRVHREFLKRYSGDPPFNNMDCAHSPTKCTSRACINPNHLRWATRSENEIDKFKTGKEVRQFGEGHVKLDAEKARAIFMASGTLNSIAKDYGVSRSAVEKIKYRKTWKWATESL